MYSGLTPNATSTNLSANIRPVTASRVNQSQIIESKNVLVNSQDTIQGLKSLIKGRSYKDDSNLQYNNASRSSKLNFEHTKVNDKDKDMRSISFIKQNKSSIKLDDTYNKNPLKFVKQTSGYVRNENAFKVNLNN